MINMENAAAVVTTENNEETSKTCDKNILRRKKTKTHSATPYTRTIPEADNEKKEKEIETVYNLVDMDMIELPFAEKKQRNVYRLAVNTYLREFDHDRFVLQKGQHSVMLCKGELQHIVDIAQAVIEGMEDFSDGKQVKYSQNLGKEVFLSIQTPYRCVDIRKFWVIPATKQLHPTKIVHV